MVRQRVVFAADCLPCTSCGEPVCQACNKHYAECDCPGPTQDDIYAYEEDADGVIWAKPRGVA